jgi:hypothetical protein
MLCSVVERNFEIDCAEYGWCCSLWYCKGFLGTEYVLRWREPGGELSFISAEEVETPIATLRRRVQMSVEICSCDLLSTTSNVMLLSLARLLT